MAQLKVYSFHPYHIYDERAKNILTEPRVQLRLTVYVAAYTKPDAARFSKDANCSNPPQTELRIAGGSEFDGLREAMLFEDEGTVLVTSDRGGQKPVVLMDPVDGVQAIGTVRWESGISIFEATMAQWAGRGSVAVGAETAYVKAQANPSYWEGTNGTTLTDEEMQLKLDLGEVRIIRSGFGDWYTAGR